MVHLIYYVIYFFLSFFMFFAVEMNKEWFNFLVKLLSFAVMMLSAVFIMQNFKII